MDRYIHVLTNMKCCCFGVAWGTGHIPIRQLFRVGDLRVLLLQNNLLNGQTTTCAVYLCSSSHIDLLEFWCFCGSSGGIPTQIGLLFHLTALDLSSNALSGT